jgi:hypothetical protein
LVGDAQVALHRLPQVVDELGQQWLVQPEGDPEIVDGLLRDVATPEQGGDGIGLHDPKQEEVEDQDENEGDGRPGEFAGDELSSTLLLRPSIALGAIDGLEKMFSGQALLPLV